MIKCFEFYVPCMYIYIYNTGDKLALNKVYPTEL